MSGIEMSDNPVSILALAEHRGARRTESGTITADAFWEVGLDIMGGCEVCAASIAAYNAFPSKSGYWRCRNCIADTGFATVEEAEQSIFEQDFEESQGGE